MRFSKKDDSEKAKLRHPSLNLWMQAPLHPEYRVAREQALAIKRHLRELQAMREECKMRVKETSILFHEGIASAVQSLRTMAVEQERSKRTIEDLKTQLQVLQSSLVQHCASEQQSKMQLGLLQAQNSNLVRELKAVNETLLKFSEKGRREDRPAQQQARRSVQQLYLQKLQLHYKYQALLRQKEETVNYVRDLQSKVGYLESELMNKKLLERQLGQIRDKSVVLEMVVGRYSDFEEQSKEVFSGLVNAHAGMKAQLEESEAQLQAARAQASEYERVIYQLQDEFESRARLFSNQLEKQRKRHEEDSAQRAEEYRRQTLRARQQFEEAVQKQAAQLAECRQNVDRQHQQTKKLAEMLLQKDGQISLLQKRVQEDCHERSTLQYRVSETSMCESKLRAMLELQQAQFRELKLQYDRSVSQSERMSRTQLISESALSSALGKIAELQKLVNEKSQTVSAVQDSFRKELRQYVSQSELRRSSFELQTRLSGIALVVEQGQDWPRLKAQFDELLGQHEPIVRKELADLHLFHLRLSSRLAAELAALFERQLTYQAVSFKYSEKISELEVEVSILRKELGESQMRIHRQEQEEAALKERVGAEKRQTQFTISSLNSRLKQLQSSSRLERQRLASALKSQEERAEFCAAQLRAKQSDLEGVEQSLESKNKEAKLLFELVQTLQPKIGEIKKLRLMLEQKEVESGKMGQQLEQQRSQVETLRRKNIQTQNRLHSQLRTVACLKEDVRRLETRIEVMNGEELRLQAELERFVEPGGPQERRPSRPSKELVRQLKQEYKEKYEQLLGTD